LRQSSSLNQGYSNPETARQCGLPKKFPVKSKELEIEKRGNEIILRERPVGMERAFYLLTELVNLDALKKRKDDKPQKRKGL
jgi:antitoxin VapB